MGICLRGEREIPGWADWVGLIFQCRGVSCDLVGSLGLVLCCCRWFFVLLGW